MGISPISRLGGTNVDEVETLFLTDSTGLVGMVNSLGPPLLLFEASVFCPLSELDSGIPNL